MSHKDSLTTLASLLNEAHPGEWETDTDLNDEATLSYPIGHRQAVEVEVGAVDTEEQFVLLFRQWDITNGLDVEKWVAAFPVTRPETAARFIAWYVKDGLRIGEWGDVVL